VRIYKKKNAAYELTQEKRRRLKNPEKRRAKERQWYKASPEKYRKRAREYYHRNRDLCVAKTREWERKNPEKSKILKTAHSHKRRAQKKLSHGAFTAKDVKEIIKLQRNKCAICRLPLGKKIHIDHIISLANGGSNNRRNIQVVHPKCNLSKHSRDPIEFMQSRGFLI
jgi:5-methylcytosine-specific restriction endonuclease McrA